MKTILLILLSFLSFGLYAQQEHESFKKDAELKDAFVKLDLTSFMSEEPVTFMFDTVERNVTHPSALNALMKTYVVFPKNTHVQKASETNNGYVQSFGIYNKTDDAIMYVRFTLNPITGKLEEVLVEKNN